MLTEKQTVKVKAKMHSPILIHICTFRSTVCGCHCCCPQACVSVGMEFSVPPVSVRQQEWEANLADFGPPRNVGFSVGDGLTSCWTTRCWPEAAVDLAATVRSRVLKSSGQSAQAPIDSSPHLPDFPVITGCSVVSSGNLSHILVLGATHWFHTLEC